MASVGRLGANRPSIRRKNLVPCAPGLKSVEEATLVRHQILYAFEVAERILDPVQRRAWLTFVIVGAGPTGVELAGAIAEIARQTLKNDFRSIRPEESQIILLDAARRVLLPFPENLAKKASQSFTALGVTVRYGAIQGFAPAGLLTPLLP